MTIKYKATVEIEFEEYATEKDYSDLAEHFGTTTVEETLSRAEREYNEIISDRILAKCVPDYALVTVNGKIEEVE